MRALLPVLLLSAATPALAGTTAQLLSAAEFNRGVLLGLNHPLPDPVHLGFVLLTGAAAALAGRMITGILAWLAAMIFACFTIPLLGDALPLRGILIGLAVLVTGCLIASARRPSRTTVAAVFAGFGLLQGAVFSATLVAGAGAVTAAGLAGYIAGFGATQALIAAAAALLALRIQPFQVRLAGAAVAVSALLLAFEVAEAALLG
ncbi:HupE/UreJ family protein [Roseobacter sp. S98]|uniref:HupE/UreJ family protein n=1 Tax=Roseobacter algicola (ex Choi et al. 2025) (nom. illeg.) TaxID=3092138 RepID=UPI0035C72CF6